MWVNIHSCSHSLASTSPPCQMMLLLGVIASSSGVTQFSSRNITKKDVLILMTVISVEVAAFPDFFLGGWLMRLRFSSSCNTVRWWVYCLYHIQFWFVNTRLTAEQLSGFGPTCGELSTWGMLYILSFNKFCPTLRMEAVWLHISWWAGLKCMCCYQVAGKYMRDCK